MSPAWQPLAAALANERLRAVYAAHVLGIESDATDKELARLAAVGLLEADGHGVNAGIFDALLQGNRTPEPEGVEKHFSLGMLKGVPAKPEARDAVLAHLAERLLPAHEELAEVDVNRLLATVSTDIPTLRRALVDHGFLTRAADGSLYQRAN